MALLLFHKNCIVNIAIKRGNTIKNVISCFFMYPYLSFLGIGKRDHS